MGIILLFRCFIAPHAAMYILREFFRDKHNGYKKFLVELFTEASSIVVYIILFYS